MKTALMVLLLFAFAAAQVSSLPRTVPAFLWTRHQHASGGGLKELVNYHTLTTEDLAQSVFSQGGWSNILCPTGKQVEFVDIALLFIGNQLQSSDISRNKHTDHKLLDLLKASFMGSNFSLAFPFVIAHHPKQPLENVLTSRMVEHCGNGSLLDDIIFSKSCSREGHKMLNDSSAFNEFVKTRMNMQRKDQTRLVVFCDVLLEYSGDKGSDGGLLSELITSLEESGASYTILYASDPYASIFATHETWGRFLAENASGNGSSVVTCDGVCQIKSSLLEGLFVGIVLLIILLWGLSSMMGIDTPSRFETPQESS